MDLQLPVVHETATTSCQYMMNPPVTIETSLDSHRKFSGLLIFQMYECLICQQVRPMFGEFAQSPSVVPKQQCSIPRVVKVQSHAQTPLSHEKK